MKNFLYLLLIVPILNISCGAEVLLIVLPAISATWCDTSDPCHKFEFRPGQEASDTEEKGNIGGANYYVSNGNKFKVADLSAAGENFIIGTYNGLNAEFAVHYRLDSNFEEYFVGSIEIVSGVKRMYVENVDTRETLTLTSDGTICDCQN